MEKYIIWHNPRCSKSRIVMNYLEENEISCDVVKYLVDSPSEDDIKNVLSLLGCTARDMMRTKESIYKELNLGDESLSEEQLVKAMAHNPKLIERPVVFNANGAVIGRPLEKVIEFVKK